MSKTFCIRAPKSMKVHKMSVAEVEKFVKKEAGRMLEAMPKDVRPVGINKVAIDSIAKETSAEVEVWGQWTRACNDRRGDIIDYVDPLIQEVEMESPLIQRALNNEVLTSELRVSTVASKKSLAKKAAKKSDQRDIRPGRGREFATDLFVGVRSHAPAVVATRCQSLCH